MIVEDLKKSIYDYAMMGKLTIQLPEDSPIENIYKFLQFDSNLTSIKENEIPSLKIFEDDNIKNKYRRIFILLILNQNLDYASQDKKLYWLIF